MKKKTLYNIYLYITLIIGIILTTFLLFFVPMNYEIETDMQQAYLVVLVIINVLLFSIIAGTIEQKRDKC
jgi:membrane protease YdiL (CAAX protease family)